jgi:hypothetical protein
MNRLARSCYESKPESELNGKSLEEYTNEIKAEWLALIK